METGYSFSNTVENESRTRKERIFRNKLIRLENRYALNGVS